jgi:hypothetical protein
MQSRQMIDKGKPAQIDHRMMQTRTLVLRVCEFLASAIAVLKRQI